MNNDKTDSVMLTFTEYEKLSEAFKQTDNFNQTGIGNLIKRLPPIGNKKVYTLAQLKYDLNHSDEIMYE